MKKRVRKKSVSEPLRWLPVDSRIFSPLLSFGHVRGVAKIFLTIEMVFAVACVIGTFALVLLNYRPYIR